MRIKGIWRLFLAFLSYHSSVCLHIIWVVYEILLSHVLCHTMIICRLLAHFIAAFISASKFSMPENVDSTAQMWLCVDLQRENIQIRVENPINMWQLASVLLSLYTNICHSFRCIHINTIRRNSRQFIADYDFNDLLEYVECTVGFAHKITKICAISLCIPIKAVRMRKS